MEAEVRVESVERSETRTGNTRWLLRDDRGTEYNAIEPLSDAEPEGNGSPDSDPDEVAWNTAVEAAPWLLGTSEPETALSPDELYERLEPFKRRVAKDIRGEDQQE